MAGKQRPASGEGQRKEDIEGGGEGAPSAVPQGPKGHASFAKLYFLLSPPSLPLPMVQLKEEGKEHRVLYRKGPEGTPLHEICLEGIINGPLDTLLAVVWEVPFFKDWWPQFSVPPFKVLESKFAHRIAPGLELSYLQFRSPWPFATRELLFFAFMVHDTATGLFVASVLSPPDDISHMDPETAALHPSAIPAVAPGCVRMTVGGGFAGQDLGGGRCYFRGACTLDMKFDLMPPWLINFVARQLAGSGYHLLCHEVDTIVKATAAAAAAGVKKCDKKKGRGAFQQLLASDPVYAGLRKAMEEYRRAPLPNPFRLDLFLRLGTEVWKLERAWRACFGSPPLYVRGHFLASEPSLAAPPAAAAMVSLLTFGQVKFQIC
ncbi:unnamed protein product [Closterium sp. Naga37s-1]|nr:unnamed protein product [Closterium sp. Naga37s-1]